MTETLTATVARPAAPAIPEGRIWVKDNRAVTFQDLPLYRGVLPVHMSVPEDSAIPPIEFKGTPMPLAVWQQAVSFLQYTYDTYGGESQLRFAYNSTTNEWRIICAPQELSRGMTTNELKEHPLREEAFKCSDEGFFIIGTLHHHCSMGAFQSGTDHSDEKGQNGLHITLGHLNKDIYDIHIRVAFRGLFYKPEMSTWFGFEETELITKVAADLYPPEWKERLVEKVVAPVKVWSPKTVHSSGYNGYYEGYGYADDSGVESDVPYWRKQLTSSSPTAGFYQTSLALPDEKDSNVVNRSPDRPLWDIGHLPEKHAPLRAILRDIYEATEGYMMESGVLDVGIPTVAESIEELPHKHQLIVQAFILLTVKIMSDTLEKLNDAFEDFDKLEEAAELGLTGVDANAVFFEIGKEMYANQTEFKELHEKLFGKYCYCVGPTLFQKITELLTEKD